MLKYTFVIYVKLTTPRKDHVHPRQQELMLIMMNKCSETTG
jgi:hypothetical protein